MIHTLLMALDLLGVRDRTGRRIGPLTAWRLARAYWRGRE